MKPGAGESDHTQARLFFAVLPDSATRECIGAATAELLVNSYARLVPRNNYHMTLAFVGAVPVRHVPIVRTIGAAYRGAGCMLRFDACEYWPTPGVIVGAARITPQALQRLSQQLHRDLAQHQWGLDVEPWRPHVTLARKVSQAPVLQAMSPFDWPVRDFCLMRSDRSGAGSAYTVVDAWPLLDDSEKA
ncbi:MAG: RNA 2',3'-cyclic phosphodiesterase [Pseudomonadota bacterium]|nr:RNA 2',3'-cyclic phosphodiesterase [Pseudomonadota bacterium]